MKYLVLLMLKISRSFFLNFLYFSLSSTPIVSANARCFSFFFFRFLASALSSAYAWGVYSTIALVVRPTAFLVLALTPSVATLPAVRIFSAVYSLHPTSGFESFLLTVIELFEGAFYVLGRLEVCYLCAPDYFTLAFVVNWALLSLLIYSLLFSIEVFVILSSFNEALLPSYALFHPLRGGLSLQEATSFGTSVAGLFAVVSSAPSL
jgi:hypothetical protein